jgi:vanillate O-demethylase monooxygenase subunit
VATRSEDLGREPTGRTVAGHPLVLYRTEDGEPVALDDRCAHRGFPLSRSRLVGDNVQCGYHGFTYAPSGVCVQVPAQPDVPGRVRVRSFPAVERRPFVWVWTGDATTADPAEIPDPGWIEEDWAVLTGVLRINGSWHQMHDNLMDLTHLTYLHDGVGGTGRYAETPPDVTTRNGRVRVERRIREDGPGAGWALGLDTAVLRHATTEWRSPALILADVVITPDPPENAPDRSATIRFFHAVTPESPTTLTYHWALARDFMVDNEELTERTLDQTVTAFQQDVEAVEWIHQLRRDFPPAEPAEVNIRVDGAGLRVRRIIADILAEEDADISNSTISNGAPE